MLNIGAFPESSSYCWVGVVLTLYCNEAILMYGEDGQKGC